MDNLYSFVYRGILTDESLDRGGRRRRLLVGAEELERLAASLSLDALDQELSQDARRMAVVYQSIHTFENMVRRFVQKALSEAFEADWWSHVSEKIRNKVTSRMEEDAQFRWHGRRGGSEIMYCDFGDLSSMIATNWPVFVDVIV